MLTLFSWREEMRGNAFHLSQWLLLHLRGKRDPRPSSHSSPVLPSIPDVGKMQRIPFSPRVLALLKLKPIIGGDGSCTRVSHPPFDFSRVELTWPSRVASPTEEVR